VREQLLRLLPYPRGLRTQAVHSLDVGEAYRLAATLPVRGAFNIAADPVLDAGTIAQALGARALELPVGSVRAAAWASWKLRLQPTSPGWLDMGMQSPLMSCDRARELLGWSPSVSSTQTVLELLAGLQRQTGLPTPPLDPAAGGPLRVRELLSGVGATDHV
jgi:nucleoside-diphosphate-sugar epimerase